MNKILIPILLIIAVIVGYFLTTKKSISTIFSNLKGTNSPTQSVVNPNGTITTTTPTGVTVTTPINTQSSTNTPTTTPTTTPITITPINAPKATNKLGLTYEGLALYKTYNGTNAPTNAVGYLDNGSLILVANTEYRDGEYKKKNSANSSGVNLGSLLGNFLIDGVYQNLYGEKAGVNLFNYYLAMGFLENGTIVYREIINGGTPNEFSYYRT